MKLSGPAVYLGIDPGLNGALCVLYINPAGELDGLRIEDIPTMDVPSPSRKSGVKRVINEAALAHLIKSIGPVRAAFIELVGSRPNQSAQSTFTFGYSTGVLRGLLAANGIPVHQLTPKSWKGFYKIPSGAPKSVSIGLASRLFPAFASYFARAKDDGRAEAALIGWCGYLTVPT